MKSRCIIIITFFLTLSVTISIRAQRDVEIIKTEALNEMNSGRYGEAIELLNRYISALPQDPNGYLWRGECYQYRKQYDLATFDFRSASRLDPHDKVIAEHLNTATNSWYSLLYNQIEGYKREIAINPNDVDSYLQIGKAYKDLGDWEEAEIWYDKYLAREHASPDEIIRYTEILAKNNHVAKGWPILKKYTEEYPNDQRLWSRYGYFSLWLGKRKIAIDAFQNALALKPYFQEAWDGLDQARGNGYIYTISNSTRHYNYGISKQTNQFVYPIDNYYAILRRHPEDNSARLSLIKDLYNAKRYEEAYQQSQILLKAINDSTIAFKDTAGFQGLYADIQQSREDFYYQQIAKYKIEVIADSTNKDAVIKLAQYYSNVQNYDSSMVLYDNYLRVKPGDPEITFLYAKAAANNQEFNKARYKMDTLLIKYPNNLDYQLFDAQLFVWSAHGWKEEELKKANDELHNVISSRPKDVVALLTLSSLNIFYSHNFDDAELYLDSAKTISPDDPTIPRLESDLAIQKSIEKSSKLFAILQEGRAMSGRGHCDSALAKYEDYMSKTPPNVLITREYADVNVCAHNYQKAINIYTDLLNKNYDYDIDVQRAKVYYYMGDTTDALAAFQRLAKDKPDDFTVNLYLGDTYSRMHEYSEANDVYDRIEDKLNPDSTQLAMIELRRGWMPPTGLRGFFSSFPNYTLLTPYASYYSDNAGVTNNTQGIRIDLGVNGFLSAGVEGFRTTLASNTAQLTSNSIRWNLTFRLASNLTSGVGWGSTDYGYNVKREIANAFIRMDERNKYSASFSYSKLDASQIIFSGSLINYRLAADLLQLAGSYKFSSGILMSGFYSRYSLADGNIGNSYNFRLGKYFYPDFIMGYEYDAASFAKSSSLYFSPSSYSANSLWAEWDLIKDSTNSLTIGGLIGQVSNSTIIQRQLYTNATFRIFNAFTLQGRVVGGNTYQGTTGYTTYSSLSVYLTAYWSL
jgi:tetratricopeptide (TPR) repeat protein